MYIYHTLINALSTHMIHINLNTIFYTHVEHSPTKTIYIRYYVETNKHTHTRHDKPCVKKSNIPVWRVSPRFSSTCRQSCWQRQHRSAAHRYSCACSGRCLQWRPTSRCRTLDQPCCCDQQSQTPPGDSPVIGEILLFIIHPVVGAWLHMPHMCAGWRCRICMMGQDGHA